MPLELCCPQVLHLYTDLNSSSSINSLIYQKPQRITPNGPPLYTTFRVLKIIPQSSFLHNDFTLALCGICLHSPECSADGEGVWLSMLQHFHSVSCHSLLKSCKKCVEASYSAEKCDFLFRNCLQGNAASPKQLLCDDTYDPSF